MKLTFEDFIDKFRTKLLWQIKNEIGKIDGDIITKHQLEIILESVLSTRNLQEKTRIEQEEKKREVPIRTCRRDKMNNDLIEKINKIEELRVLFSNYTWNVYYHQEDELEKLEDEIETIFNFLLEDKNE